MNSSVQGVRPSSALGPWQSHMTPLDHQVPSVVGIDGVCVGRRGEREGVGDSWALECYGHRRELGTASGDQLGWSNPTSSSLS